MVRQRGAFRVILTLLVMVGIILSSATADAARKKKRTRHIPRPPAPYVEKFAAIVVDAASGRVLYERMAGETRYPASLTKMMTLYLLFEQLSQGKISLSTTLTASAYAASQDPSRLGLNAGDTLTVEEAIKALVVRSANDVAVVIAEHLGGSEYQFATRMTRKARDLGMMNTNFVNASGLPDENQKTTAFDLMLLSQHLTKDFPEFFPYFRMQSFVWNGRSYEGHNNLLKFFDGADGLKTGYTRMSGFNLASSATRQGTRLISVVMGGRSARERDIMTAELLEAEFSRLGLGRPAPQIIAMSPLVPDEDEAAGTSADASAKASRPSELAANVPAPTPKPGAAGNESAGLRPTIPSTASMAPIPDQTGQGDSEDAVRRPVIESGSWGIQVGAHASRENAETQLRTVKAQMRDLLKRATSAIVTLEVNGDTFYRVRFGAFTPNRAETLCEQIQKRGVSCLVVTDGAWDKSSSRANRPIAVR